MASVIDDFPARKGLFREGARIQGRVIFALIMRDLHTRYGRENIGYLWLILEPMLLATAVGLIHVKTAAHFTGDIKPVPAALIGYGVFMTFRSMVTRAEGVLEANTSLFHHRTITPFDLLFARALLEQAGTLMALIILMSLAVATGIANPPERPLIFLAGLVAMFLLSFGMSMVVCGITHERRSVGRLVHPITYILMPLSGAFFILHALPTQYREILLVVPLSHIFEMLRYGWFKSAHPEYIDLQYLGAWIAGSLLIGMLSISLARKHIQSV